MRPSVRPGEGERGAISGYYGQYYVAAAVILKGLREEGLEWVRVADPEAGRVDDLQIGSKERVDAYQVKWSQYTGLVTFTDLTAETNQTPSLIAHLAQGWRELKERYHGCRVVVHLLTNKSPSPHANIPMGTPPPTPPHFAAFLAQVWEPFQRGSWDTFSEIPEEWRATWDALRIASSLCGEDFEAFVKDCSLDFGYQLPFSSASMSVIDRQIATEDIEHIIYVIFQTVADPARIIQLTRYDLLRQLNWTRRFELVNSHQFPVNETLYQPIEPSVQQIMDAVGRLPGGYIAVLGSPGSGKSTLLTKTLRELSERVFSYYAYVPDASYPVSLRGESANFLHDVGIQLERAGFTVGSSPSRLDRHQLLDRFYGQLELLKQDREKTGRKTFILIDGLDHIEREQQPRQSLLSDLPDPIQIPSGVYFVLGTQTVAPLSGRIQSSLGKQGRSITMQPLGRQQAHEMFKAADLGIPMTMEQQDLAYDLSSGHPLYLAYLINRMKLIEDPQRLNEELQAGHVFDGNIEAAYQTYWNQFADDAELTHLLGLLARIRGVIDFSWIRTWGSDSAIARLGNRFAHYFRIEDTSRWYFFHNSFRLFLVAKTAEFPAGTVNPINDCAYHIVLADLCGEDSAQPAQAWEEVYHRAAGDQHDKVLKMAT